MKVPLEITVHPTSFKVLSPADRGHLMGFVGYSDGKAKGFDIAEIELDKATAGHIALLIDKGVDPYVMATEAVKQAKDRGDMKGKLAFGSNPLYVHFEFLRNAARLYIPYILLPKGTMPMANALKFFMLHAVEGSVIQWCKLSKVEKTSFKLQAKALSEQADLLAQASQEMDRVPDAIEPVKVPAPVITTTAPVEPPAVKLNRPLVLTHKCGPKDSTESTKAAQQLDKKPTKKVYVQPPASLPDF